MTAYLMKISDPKQSQTFIMKRSVSYLATLLLALMTLSFADTTLASGGKIDVRHTIIATFGGASPSGGNYFFFRNARLNAQPGVTFDAFVTLPTPTGVFVGDGRTTSTIALGGDPVAGGFGFVMDPFITPNGKVVFDDSNRGIFRSDTREIIPLVQSGDPAPGGGTLVLGSTYVANDGGAVAYDGFVSGSTATQGIFRSDGTQTLAIARDDIAPPTGGNFTDFLGIAINDIGQVAFESEMSGGASDFGIFRGEGGGLIPIFVANQIAPNGKTFADFGDPVINAHGQIAAVCTFTDSSEGLFVGDGTTSVPIALPGEPAPKGGNYGQFSAYPEPHRLNDRGEVAFHVQLTGGTSSGGLFRGDGKSTTTVALSGAIAPGTTGMFETFYDIKLGVDSRVAFIAKLVDGVGGVNSSNDMGIWVGTSDEDLQLVVRTGDVVGGRVLTGLSMQVERPSEFDMNQNGVVWIGDFQFPARAVVFSQFLGENSQP